MKRIVWPISYLIAAIITTISIVAGGHIYLWESLVWIWAGVLWAISTIGVIR